MSYEIAGKQVFITGASAGIGAEFARQLHAKGANLILTARRTEKLSLLKDELEQSRASSVTLIPADLTKTTEGDNGIDGLEGLCDKIRQHRVDIFINNAGIGSFGFFEKIPFSFEEQIIQLNVYATTRLAHCVIGQMKERNEGAYISISSVAGFEPLPYMATYAASKAFNLFHTLALRQELSEFGIRAMTVCPGPTETEFFGVARMPGTATGVKRDRVQDVVAESIRALESNKAVIATGLRAKLMVFAVRLLPFSLTTAITKRMLHAALPK